jgi:hypothetical protein
MGFDEKPPDLIEVCEIHLRYSAKFGSLPPKTERPNQLFSLYIHQSTFVRRFFSKAKPMEVWAICRVHSALPPPAAPNEASRAE